MCFKFLLVHQIRGTEKSCSCKAREDRDARRTGGTLSVSARSATQQMDFYRSRLLKACFGRAPVDILKERLDVIGPLQTVIDHERMFEDIHDENGHTS